MYSILKKHNSLSKDKNFYYRILLNNYNLYINYILYIYTVLFNYKNN